MPTFGERWKFFWKAHDPDDVFAYDTLKFVTIRDRYLGMLHHAFQLGILVYVIGIVIFYQKQFLRREVPDGLIRLSVLNGAGVDSTAQKHCNSLFSQGPPFCTYPTQDEIVTGGGSSMLHLPSYFTSTDIGKTCVDTINCVSNITAGPTAFVVANFDKFSLSIDHSFQTARGVTLGDFTPVGYLKSPKKTSDGRSYKNTIRKFNSLSSDILTISELLAATQEKGRPFDLDKPANEYLNHNEDPNFKVKSYREFGLVILLVVDYSNIANYWQGCQRDENPCFEYSYELAAIPSIEDYAQDTIYTVYPTNRTTLDKRGIRIIGVMSGEIGSFNFQVLLVQLTTSLALIKVATTVVDQIAIRLLPRKAAYREAKYERTEDFSEKFKKEREAKRSKSVEMDQMAGADTDI